MEKSQPLPSEMVCNSQNGPTGRKMGYMLILHPIYKKTLTFVQSSLGSTSTGFIWLGENRLTIFRSSHQSVETNRTRPTIHSYCPFHNAFRSSMNIKVVNVTRNIVQRTITILSTEAHYLPFRQNLITNWTCTIVTQYFLGILSTCARGGQWPIKLKVFIVWKTVDDTFLFNI